MSKCTAPVNNPIPRVSKPPWLRRRALTPGVWTKMKTMLDGLALATVCEEARCPNIGECFAEHTATFLVLGRTCTRRCQFCAVHSGVPEAPDPDEPRHLASAVHSLGLCHVVITSVTRDDLLDGGAQHFAACVRAVRRAAAASIELLVPDFRGAGSALQTVLDAGPDVLGHNVEVVPRLYPKLRARADYLRSLELLQRARRAQPGIYSKSGLMVGVGETEAEVIAVMRDLREVGCDLLTIGQYLQPSAEHFPLVEYVAPATFERYARLAKELGFLGVSCGPFVRSSYLARELLLAARDPRAEE